MLPPWKIATALCAVSVSSQQVHELRDVSWTVSNGHNVSVRANFPSHAHLDLYKAGVIGEPLYGYNDVNDLWVTNSNWTYTSAPLKSLAKSRASSTWLVFDGLDTFTAIWFCDQLVGNTNNQYRQWTFDVSKIMQRCRHDPVVKLNFGPAPKIVLDLAKNGPDYVNTADGVKGALFDGRAYMRKQQSDFGWDWSPALGPSGPWRDARVVQSAHDDPVHIQNTVIDIYRRGQRNNLPPDISQPWVFNASLDYLGSLGSNPSLHLTLADKHGRAVLRNVALKNLTRNNMTITGSVEIQQPVELWWPNELGDQNLYQATISVSGRQSKHTATVTKRVGFRSIVLNQTPISTAQAAQGVSPGANWHFEVNGKEFYAKGANLVPPDPFWPRVNETHMRQLFGLATAAHNNMLRVWSSGAYLDDWIYDLADEMGLLLWSEFEFSDTIYPDTPEYLANYEAEAYYNVRRVNHHPSLALWAGGNELETILLGFWSAPGPVLSGYEKIFEELLIKCVYANSRSISYIPSSTYKGYLGDIDFNSVRPQTPRYNNVSGPNDLYSDTDYYNYDATQAFNLTGYPVGRFADEFGFISMPSVQSWQEAIPEHQLYYSSDSVLHHNRHSGGSFGFNGTQEEGFLLGMDQMSLAVNLYYPVPNTSDMVANFTSWCYTTQVFHGEYYASQIAFYRRGSGRGERQLGSLYWQLNDLWVGPTWAAIEANNRPKVTYYSVKDAYKPVIAWSYYDVDTDELEVWVTSDRLSKESGVVTLQWFDYQGNQLHSIKTPDEGSSKLRFTIGALNSTKVATYPSVSSLFSKSMPASNAFLRVSMETTAKKGAKDTHVSYFHPTTLKNAQLRDPGLKLDSLGRNKFRVTATKAVAAWVWLDWPSTVSGAFDENGIWLNRGESKVVEFEVWDDWTSRGQWEKDVRVWSIWDNTRE